MSVAQQHDGRSQQSRGLSRRHFLAGISSGSLVLMGKTLTGQDAVVANAATTDAENFSPDFFVAISPNNTVTIVAHRSEMGTGIRTGLPRVVADELEADWDRVVIQQAPGDKRLGDQNTDGSNSIRFFFKRMRVAGAIARTMLEQAAAQKWGVPANECYADNHKIKHTKSDRAFDFGELVDVAKRLDVPLEENVTLKPRSKWRYIGKDAPITDLDDIVTGKATFGIDARMENQLYAVIARPPVAGGRVKSFDATDAKQIPGVVDVAEIPPFQGAPMFQPLGGIAVLADSTWAAWQGRDALKIEWDHGANASYNSDEYTKQLAATVNQPGDLLREVGDPVSVIDKTPKNQIVAADYSVPHLAHAPMETTCAVADVKTDAAGKVTSAHVVTATQNPQAVQGAVGPAMGMKPEDVLVNVTLLGSGFGRKSKPDYCVEAAMLSRQMKRPVHVTWTREDDLAHDYLHAVSAIHCEAAVDDNGKPTAWLQRVAYPSIGSTFNPLASSPATWEAEMGHSDLPFDIPNLRFETGNAKAHTRIGWLRSVCHIQQNFAVSSFADELAHNAGKDPLEFLLELLGDDRHVDLKAAKLSNRGAAPTDYPYDIGRLKNVLKRSATAANWVRRKGLPKGRGLGIACARSFLGYTGHVVEVDVAKDGALRIPKIWCSIDAGTIVSPDRVRSQIEGAAIMATTQARYGKITFTNGRVNEVNYDDYQMTTMADAPREIVVDIVNSTAPPAGVGETGVPSCAPALCNAIFAATGKRIRNLPLADHDLSWA
ncbi:MAG: xanthine dehydrogenase family protein molybdopterin-binding subunit [Planctomycetales bacterium]|nr:xanthine dehydrogenase family protein molybdopterin-binding subunit [Planctomycetales bacterium]